MRSGAGPFTFLGLSHVLIDGWKPFSAVPDSGLLSGHLLLSPASWKPTPGLPVDPPCCLRTLALTPECKEGHCQALASTWSHIHYRFTRTERSYSLCLRVAMFHLLLILLFVGNIMGLFCSVSYPFQPTEGQN